MYTEETMMNISAIGKYSSIQPTAPLLARAQEISPSSRVSISVDGMKWFGLSEIAGVLLAVLILALLK